MIKGKKSLLRNFGVSIFAQIISLCVSFVLNLIVPKLIDEYQYSYWQSFALYSGYVGVLMFGILDGLVLRYSQYDYDQLDKPRIRSQFRFVVLFGVFFGLILFIVSCFITDQNARIILVLISIITITRNIYGFGIYMLQITNRFKKYATVVIAHRLTYGLLVVVALLSKFHDFYWICIFEIIGDIFAIVLSVFYSHDLYWGSSIDKKASIIELKNNISAGILLMAASWFSMLFVGMAKTTIQWKWGNIVFGKVSFAFSLTNLFLSFVSAISVVLFPTLKRMDTSELPNLYRKIRNLMSPLLISIMFLFFPISFLLQKWLPHYSISLKYVALLLPCIIFTSKVSILTNNYIKAFRMEKKLLTINLMVFAGAISLYLFSAYVIKSVEMILIIVDIALFIRYVALECCLTKHLGYSFVRNDIIECIVSALFILIAYNCSWLLGMGFYFVVLVVFLLLEKKDIKIALRKQRGTNE